MPIRISSDFAHEAVKQLCPPYSARSVRFFVITIPLAEAITIAVFTGVPAAFYIAEPHCQSLPN